MLKIRTASPDDAKLMASLEQRIFPEDPWPAHDIASMAEMPYIFSFIVEDADEPIGYAMIQGAPKSVADILTIGVVPEHRRKGGAEALLEAMFDAVRKIGVETVYLEVRESNKGAHKFYEKHGGEFEGKRPRYFRALEGMPAEDAFVYRFALAESE